MESGGQRRPWVELAARTKPDPHLLFGCMSGSQEFLHSWTINSSVQGFLFFNMRHLWWWEESVPLECLDIRETKT